MLSEQIPSTCKAGGVLPFRVFQDFEDSGSDDVDCGPSNKDSIAKVQGCVFSPRCSIEISRSPFVPFKGQKLAMDVENVPP